MKSRELIERRIYGALRAWLEGGQQEGLKLEAVALLWTTDDAITWAGAGEIFEEMASDLRADLGMEEENDED